MPDIRHILSKAAFVALLTWLASSGAAIAGGLCSDIVVLCDNGRSYPLCPIAVSDEGEIVTGWLQVGPRRRGVHVRLVPMGVGYRYITRGIWLDGDGPDAEIHFGKHRVIACTVARP